MRCGGSPHGDMTSRGGRQGLVDDRGGEEARLEGELAQEVLPSPVPVVESPTVESLARKLNYITTLIADLE